MGQMVGQTKSGKTDAPKRRSNRRFDFQRKGSKVRQWDDIFF